MIYEMLNQYPDNPQALVECEKMMDEFYEEGKLTIYELRTAQRSVARKKENYN
jgi:hypothetical protein